MADPIRLRASSVSELLDCPLRWKKKNLDGLRLPSTPPAAIGSAVHLSTAVYDQGRIDGSGTTIDEAAGSAVDLLQNPNEEIDWQGMRQAKAADTAVRVHIAYCQEIAPHHNYVLVEHTLEPRRIDMGDGVIFELTGTLDRIREENGLRGVSDVKTGQAAVSPSGEVAVGKHLPQLGEYELLAEYEFGPMLLPSGIIGLHTGGASRVGFREVIGAKESLIGSENQPGLLHYVAQYFRSGLFPPNPGSFMCSERYCPYHKACRFHG